MRNPLPAYLLALLLAAPLSEPCWSQASLPRPGGLQPGPATRVQVLVENVDRQQILPELVQDGRGVLLRRQEFTLGSDLNGDGDTEDAVFHSVDLVTGAVHNLELAHLAYGLGPVGNGRALIAVHELEQGADLNGDGDLFDQVAYAVDLATGQATSSGLAFSGPSAVLVGDRVCFVADDSEVRVWDLAGGGAPVSTGLFALPYPLAEQAGFLLFLMSEPRTGADLNGDGDLFDFVLAALDLQTLGRPVVTGLAVGTGGIIGPVLARGAHSAFLVPEQAQGMDLNGDGDLGDQVLHVFDMDTAVVTNLGLAVENPHLFSGLELVRPGLTLSESAVAFHVPEAAQGGSDLNGDGDALDGVLFVHRFDTHATVGLGLAAWDLALDDEYLVFHVREDAQGASDLDGDGDADDFVPHVHRLADGSTTSLGVASGFLGATPSSSSIPPAPALQAPWVAFPHPEAGQDLNGDGDGLDVVPYLVDLVGGTGGPVPVAATPGPFLQPGELALRVSEAQQGEDLDGDGLLVSRVAQVLHVASGQRADTRTHGFFTGPAFANRYPLLVGPPGQTERTLAVARVRF